MDAGSSIPSVLPLLPVVNQVLLPTAFIRIQVSSKSLRSVALLEQFSAKPAKELLVAVVPCLVPSDTREPHDESKAPRLDRLSPVGTAARVLQLSRLVQSGDWVVLLEGLARVSLQGLAARPGEAFDSVNVQALELASSGSSSSGSSAKPQQRSNGNGSAAGRTIASAGSPIGPKHPSGAGLPGAAGGQQPGAGAADVPPAQRQRGAQDDAATVAELGAQLKQDTRLLLQLLSRQAGLPAARRLLELLEAVPGWRAADVVAAALARNSQERLAVLLALDHASRIRLALRLVQQALEAVGAAAGQAGSSSNATDSSTAGKAGRGSGRQQQVVPAGGGRPAGLPGRQRGSGVAPGSGLGFDEADGDEDDVAVIMARLAAAGPPPEVLRAAAREARRLRQGGEAQPGAAAARAYLELLADLPWSTRAHQLKARQQQQQHAGQTSAAAGPFGSSAAGSAAAGETASERPPAATAASDTPAAAAAGPPPPMPLCAAQSLLDAQHYGLAKVKTRIIEHLAVSRLRGSSGRAPVLCFIGPPGVGKTSLARSIAEVLGAPFGRIALGGVRDEAEIRGHRRTYVGAMPGRLISAVRKAGCRDPLLLLDEVDKMGHDHRGDPAAALLEVLDPEQNHAFTDTYLGLPFDLSGVTFVCTANRAADIPPPLLDRLEVISLAGYTLREKVHICQSHLLPGLLAEHGLGPQLVAFPRPTLEYVITGHTREAGVRGLRRALAAVCRHVALNVVLEHEAAATAAAAAAGLGSGVLPPSPTATAAIQCRSSTAPRQQQQHQQQLIASSPGQHTAYSSSPGVSVTTWAKAGQAAVRATAHAQAPLKRNATDIRYDGVASRGPPYPPDLLARAQSRVVVDVALVQAVLGPPQYQGADDVAAAVSGPGVAAGLVWTAVGGGVQFVECVRVGEGRPGQPGQLTLTGQVGEVLEESARIALSWLRAHAWELGLEGQQQQQQQAAAAQQQQQHYSDGGNRFDRPLPPPLPAAASGYSGGAFSYQHNMLTAASAGSGAAVVAGGELSSLVSSITSNTAAAMGGSSTDAVYGSSSSMTSPLQWDIHVHLPAGAVPKDGPSAGITLAVVILSLLSGRPVRSDTAMTGELTLRGLVLPVGGIKEKLLAARAAGLARALVPARNMRDVELEAGEATAPHEDRGPEGGCDEGGGGGLGGPRREGLAVVPVATLEEVLAAAFDPPYLLRRRSRL
ncbi:hypothetical protein OEZ86_014737 [Tetradesmus obliquus]|nr:hypothetical protein OEZ86_014737 [Tetradesmus obliquus]